MPVTVEELPDSRPLTFGVKGRQWTTGANLSVEFSYQVRGTASDVDAKNTKKLVDKANTGGLTFA